MVDPKFISDMAKKLADAVPKSMKTLSNDMEKNFKEVLKTCFSKMDLVTRAEFNAQKRVLERTRKKVDEMEKAFAPKQPKAKTAPKEANKT